MSRVEQFEDIRKDLNEEGKSVSDAATNTSSSMNRLDSILRFRVKRQRPNY